MFAGSYLLAISPLELMYHLYFLKKCERFYFSAVSRQSDDVIALLRVDSRIVGHTEARPVSQQAWDQRFSVDLDRVR